MSLGLALKLANATLFKGGDPTLLWDEDFANQVYRYNRVRYPAVTDLPGTTFTRATTKYAANSAGVLVPFGVGVPAITDAGVSVEAAATNLLTYSQQFDNAGWSKSGGASVTADATVAPDGTLTADTWNGSGGLISNEPAAAASTAYFAAIFFKAGTATTFGVTIQNRPAFSQTAAVTVNPVTGATSGLAGNSPSATVVPLADGWFCLKLGGSTPSGATTQVIVINGANGTLSLWGAQLETGSFATSYIPTTTAAVTRNADVLVTADSVISPTIVAEFTVPPTGALFGRVWEANDGTSSNRIRLLYDRAGNVLYATADVGGAGVMSLNLGAGTPGQTFKVAMRIAASNFSASKNGGTCVTAAAGALPPVTTFFIGGAGYGGEWGSGIRKIKRYSVAKTNAELQALST